jgi:hypothetical protein
MMGPASHFLIGTLCGAAIAAVAVAVRRRWAVYLPPFVLACGLWAEAPCLLGVGQTRHWLANVFFGYAWLHPWVQGRELAGFLCVVAIANLLLLGYVVFLTWCFWTMDTVRWEQGGWEREKRRSKRRRSSGRRRAE